MQCIRSNIFKTLFTVALFSANFAVHAEGMVPETSLLIIDEATHSGTINVKNTDSHPSLLYTNVVDLPDDQGLKLIVTQPVVRLEPGQTQQLRFILQSKQPLDVEHLKRVTFDGIPPKNDDKKIKIGINIRQDIPVLIRPATLGVVTDAWKYLKWSTVGSSVKVTNPSKYVVRLAQKVVLQPSGANARCEKEGVGISVMKPFNAGQLLDAKKSPFGQALTPAQCIQYALDRPAVLTVMQGAANVEELKRNLSYLDASAQERDYSVIGSFTPKDMKGTCVYCKHCHPCPAGLDIGLINKYYDLSRLGDVLAKEHYLTLEKTASDCLQCGHCNSRCPFSVDQMARMEEIQKYFGR